MVLSPSHPLIPGGLFNWSLVAQGLLYSRTIFIIYLKWIDFLAPEQDKWLFDNMEGIDK